MTQVPGSGQEEDAKSDNDQKILEELYRDIETNSDQGDEIITYKGILKNSKETPRETEQDLANPSHLQFFAEKLKSVYVIQKNQLFNLKA